MNKIRISLIALFLAGVCLAGVQAQETIAAAGGDARGTGGSATYTLGQVAGTTISGPGGIAVQGVQQSFSWSFRKGPGKGSTVHVRCSVYPNPVTDQLHLCLESKDELPPASLSYRLCAANGAVMLKKRIAGTECVIPFRSLAPAVYRLQILDGKNVVTEFSLIKY